MTAYKGVSDMKNIGYVYMDRVGNVCFQIGDFHIEYIASKILTKINGVIEYDNTGYVVLDTNYGEELLGLPEPPPSLTATMISLAILVNAAERLASAAPLVF